MDYKPFLLTGALLANSLDLSYAQNSYSYINNTLMMGGVRTSELENEVEVVPPKNDLDSFGKDLVSFMAISSILYFVYQMGKTIREERDPPYKRD